jgi:tetratricopeptide (TPR) repeat protein
MRDVTKNLNGFGTAASVPPLCREKYLTKVNYGGIIGSMKRQTVFFWCICLAVSIVAFSCVSTDGGLVSAGQISEAGGHSLDEAIELSAEDVTTKLPNGTRVAIVAFSTEHMNLSNYIMDELTGALVDGRLEVADRRNLEYVYKELNFQMSGEVSDETAVSIGKFLGARYVITGQLVKAGDRYRYRLSGINVETAVQESSTRLNVRNDRILQSLITEVRQTSVITTSAGYGDRQNAQSATAGAYLDRGMLFASRRDWDTAIVEYTEAIKLDPKLAVVYDNRAFAYNEKGDYDRAIADCTQAIRLDPNNAVPYARRAFAYNEKGDYDRAIADYTQAIRLNSTNALLYDGRALAYNGKGDYDRAIADCTQAIRLDPNNAVPYARRAWAYGKKGDTQRANTDNATARRLGYTGN